MATKIALISEDKDFFNFIKEKLLFRKADELFSFSFDDVPERVHMLSSAVLFINGENMYDKTLDLLDIIKGIPAVVFTYNEDTSFKEKCYEKGVLDCLTILISTKELRSRLIPILNTSSLLQKNIQYREILVSNKLLSQNNEVFLLLHHIQEFLEPLLNILTFQLQHKKSGCQNLQQVSLDF